MSKINFYEIDNIRNINEKRVWKLLTDYLEIHKKVCTCQDCVLDMAVITLNNIKPHYQVTNENIYNRIKEKVTDNEILNEIEKAVAIVREKPHHL
jgi:competence protein ComFB